MIFTDERILRNAPKKVKCLRLFVAFTAAFASKSNPNKKDMKEIMMSFICYRCIVIYRRYMQTSYLGNSFIKCAQPVYLGIAQVASPPAPSVSQATLGTYPSKSKCPPKRRHFL